VLRKISDIYFRPGEPKRLWFTDDALDLYIWISDEGHILKFQFTYDKPCDEKSLLWQTQSKLRANSEQTQSNLSHTSIDDGCRPGKHPSSPILLGEVALDASRVIVLLKQNSAVIPQRYFLFIQEKILSRAMP
jgi:hypothetical protein